MYIIIVKKDEVSFSIRAYGKKPSVLSIRFTKLSPTHFFDVHHPNVTSSENLHRFISCMCLNTGKYMCAVHAVCRKTHIAYVQADLLIHIVRLIKKYITT